MALMDVEQDSAQVGVPPPLMLVACVLLGLGLHGAYPIQLVPDALRFLLALPFFAVGVGTVFSCATVFKKAKTEIKPWKTTSTIITTGVYGFSRNPIYCSFVLVGASVAFAVNSLWVVLSQVLLVVILNKLVIQKEERYLEQKFGDEYRAYKERVRRWI